MPRWVVLLATTACLYISGCKSGQSPDSKNIILISLDTVRADRLGAWGNTRSLTPNLDRFAAESVVFDQAFSQSNETLYSHASLFTSRYPSELSPLDAGFSVPKDVPLLAEVLANYGFQTAGFVAGGHMASRFGLSRGFGVYDDTADWGSLLQTGKSALTFIDKRDSQAPLFLFVHGYDAHDRYLKPTPFGYAFADPNYSGIGGDIVRWRSAVMGIADGIFPRAGEPLIHLTQSRTRFEYGRGLGQMARNARPLLAEDDQHIADVYDGAIAYADMAFGLFMAGLSERGLLESSTIVVFSDHGEGLGEQGVYSHRLLLDDSTLHVPLMIRPAGGTTGHREPGLVELIDVLPTILAWAGAQLPAGARGHSLAQMVRADAPLNAESPASGAEGSFANGRKAAFSESGLRMVSGRGPTTRVTCEGISVDNPLLAGLIAGLPIGGVSLRYSGDAEGAPAVRDAMVAWRHDLILPRVDPGRSSTLDAQMREHGYWPATP